MIVHAKLSDIASNMEALYISVAPLCWRHEGENVATNQTQADWQKTALRLPRDLHQQVHAAAKANDRTFNGQIVAFLKDCVRSGTKEAKHAKAAA